LLLLLKIFNLKGDFKGASIFMFVAPFVGCSYVFTVAGFFYGFGFY